MSSTPRVEGGQLRVQVAAPRQGDHREAVGGRRGIAELLQDRAAGDVHVDDGEVRAPGVSAARGRRQLRDLGEVGAVAERQPAHSASTGWSITSSTRAALARSRTSARMGAHSPGSGQAPPVPASIAGRPTRRHTRAAAMRRSVPAGAGCGVDRGHAARSEMTELHTDRRRAAPKGRTKQTYSYPRPAP